MRKNNRNQKGKLIYLKEENNEGITKSSMAAEYNSYSVNDWNFSFNLNYATRTEPYIRNVVLSCCFVSRGWKYDLRLL